MVVRSADIAEAEGITDDMIEKLALIGKSGQMKKVGDIEKEIDGDADGQIIAKGHAAALRRIIDEKLQKEIPSEEHIPNDVLDGLARYADLREILSTMMGVGIHPKPREFQRIVIIKIGRPDIADFLDRNNLIFNPDEQVTPIECPIHKSFFNDSIAKYLMPFMQKRSCFPDYLEPRLEKVANAPWEPQEKSKILTPGNILAGVAALFAGLKMKAMGIGPKQVLDIMVEKPWIGTMLGAGLAYKLRIS